ncbi:MAG TPA: ankyrin repeat domain-containing protein [Thermoanaerobaculia bacterium]
MIEIAARDPQAVALVAAIQTGDVDALQRMLDETPALATARIVDEQRVSRTLLHIVADWPGHFPNAARAARLLIERGADPDARVVIPGRAGKGEAPLHWAASSDDVALIEALLDAGASLEVTGAVFTGGTPMSDAVVFAQWKAARRLLERGARTTIWQAAALGLLDRVQEAFTSGEPPSDHDVTNAFWNACRGGQQAAAELLLARGAGVNWIGHDGKTPLDAAQESGNAELLAWLRQQGATASPHRAHG